MLRAFRGRWSALGAAVLTVAALAIGGWLWINRYLSQAQRAMDDLDWNAARKAAATYLYFHPADSSAHLLMAEALIRDSKLFGEEKIFVALEHLALIPDSSSRAADARLHEGRLRLLLLSQPGQAEGSLLRSLAADPKRLETHSLLWKLYDLTNRWDRAEEHFWQVYDQTSPPDRTIPLRNWYLSEFSPGTANAELDRHMGFLAQENVSSSESDRRRMEAFVIADPQWPEGYVILARWFHRQGALQQTRELLDQAEQLPGGKDLPALIALRVTLEIELGNFETAQQVFARWTNPRAQDSYEYHKTAGLVADQILREPQQASESYQQAILTTAGKSDWLTQHRLAQCLSRLGKADQAATVRQHSKQVESLMETALHVRLRRALLTPSDPHTIAQLVDLYQQLGRTREAKAWMQLATSHAQTDSQTARTKARAVSNEQ